MASAASIDDFFGVGILGADPFAQQKTEKLTRLQQMDQLLTSAVNPTATSPSGRTPSTGYAPRTQVQPQTGASMAGGSNQIGRAHV